MSRALNLCPSVLANLIHLAHELARALQTPGPTPTPQGRYASALPTGNEALDEFLLDLNAAPQGALKDLQLDLEASVCAALYALARLGPVHLLPYNIYIYICKSHGFIHALAR